MKLTLGQQRVNENLFYFKDTLTDFSTKTKYSGNYTAYYPGHIRFKGNFVDGLKNGEFIYYRDPAKSSNLQGLKDSVVNYFNGVLDGEKLVYFNNYTIDLLREKLNYSKGRLNGLCYYWDYSFQLSRIANYYYGNLVEEKLLETDTTISEIAVTLKEFPNNTINLKELTDSVTLEVVGIVPDYSQKEYKFSLKPLPNFTIKSYTVLRHLKYQHYKTPKFSSSIFKYGNTKADGDVSVVNLILIDKNNVEYEIPRIYFRTE